MNKHYELRYLSDGFCVAHSHDRFPEMEVKGNRPYLVYLLQIDGHLFAIPFRTNMPHGYGYRFKNTDRETNSSTGLDFTKAVVISSSDDLSGTASISNKEFVELSKKHFFIRKKFTLYVANYHKFVRGELNDFQAKAYRFSTLKYFHKELQIEV